MGANHWTNFDWSIVSFDELSLSMKRKRLFNEAKYSCTECGFSKCRENGRHILEIHHIDGNHQNNSKENLCVLCPNCHALTPNYKNHGRKNRDGKSSTRLRKGNKEFEESRRIIQQQKRDYENYFKNTVLSTHEMGEIDYSKFGWAQRLAEKLNDLPQVVGRRLRRLMPEFFALNCHSRAWKRILSQ